MQPETKMGPGAGTPEPLCIAFVANAVSPYAFHVAEGNRNALVLALSNAGGFLVANGLNLSSKPARQAETPENAL
jgi:hypothetical protein